MTTRPRPTSTLPRPPTTLAPTAVIADAALLTGVHRVAINSNVVIHPRARITSTHGAVTIGEGCIVSERAIVGAVPANGAGSGDAEADGSVGKDVVLSRDVVLEPAAVVELGASVGEGTVLEAGSRVCAGAVVGKYCKIGPLCVVRAREILPDFTIVFGAGQRRTERPGLQKLRRIAHDKEIEVLRRLVPSNLAKWQTGSGPG